MWRDDLGHICNTKAVRQVGTSGLVVFRGFSSKQASDEISHSKIMLAHYDNILYMKHSWNKGMNKYTHPSIMKTSLTMRSKGIDNFKKWRDDMKRAGSIRSKYPALKKNGDLAELIGVILGDGHISRFPRVDELSLFSNAANTGFVERYRKIIENIFEQKPSIAKHGSKNCTMLRIYQKHIQSRIGIPYSPRKGLDISVPEWILRNRSFVVRYLRGLYEAEGSHCIHKSTSTYKIFFTNRNKSMLDNVSHLVSGLGFHPHRSKDNIQISRKREVEDFIELIEFRKY